MLARFENEFSFLMALEYIVDSQQIRTVTEEGRSLFNISEDELLGTGEDVRDAFLVNAEELYNRLDPDTQ